MQPYLFFFVGALVGAVCMMVVICILYERGR